MHIYRYEEPKNRLCICGYVSVSLSAEGIQQWQPVSTDHCAGVTAQRRVQVWREAVSELLLTSASMTSLIKQAFFAVPQKIKPNNLKNTEAIKDRIC